MMNFSQDELQLARQLRAGDWSYASIGAKLGREADEIRDALIPGWREKPIARGRHNRKAVNNGAAS